MQQPLAIAAWIISLGLFSSFGWGIIHYRGPIQAAWPPSERFYHAARLG